MCPSPPRRWRRRSCFHVIDERVTDILRKMADIYEFSMVNSCVMEKRSSAILIIFQS